MGVLSNKEIMRHYETGNVIIDPLIPENVNGSSVDVTLGEHFYATDPNDDRYPKLFNPYDQEDVDRYFRYFQAQPFAEHEKMRKVFGPRELEGIPKDAKVVILRPGERVLAHTQEFIGIKEGTTSMHAKSSMGRIGVAVCYDAGWGDPGYWSRWTSEIQNTNEHEHIVLVVGAPFAQIAFHETGPVESEYSKLSGNYQPSGDLEELKKLWTPEMMLPRLGSKPVRIYESNGVQLHPRG
ncbi:MAG: deoxycytidine triphosphate deaminase [Candidatus Saccharibacteria bacterium]|nr:deoxycytidine triphosphate deaminase [Candidatus Saccharibacteria bacterium]